MLSKLSGDFGLKFESANASHIASAHATIFASFALRLNFTDRTCCNVPSMPHIVHMLTHNNTFTLSTMQTACIYSECLSWHMCACSKQLDKMCKCIQMRIQDDYVYWNVHTTKIRFCLNSWTVSTEIHFKRTKNTKIYVIVRLKMI